MSAALLVADSGPLIALARLNLLGLPSQLFSETLVTATVWHELTRAAPPVERQLLSDALSAGHLRELTIRKCCRQPWLRRYWMPANSRQSHWLITLRVRGHAAR